MTRRPSTEPFGVMRLALSPRMGRVTGWVLALLLAAGLPLQSVTSALADLLGPRHAHGAMASGVDQADPMAGWRDFRRAQYDLPTEASVDAGASAHALAHATGERHHHDLFDTTVEQLETADGNDAVGAGTTPVTTAPVFMAAGAAMPLAPPGQAQGDGWRTLRDVRFRSAALRRLDRPPQHPG